MSKKFLCLIVFVFLSAAIASTALAAVKIPDPLGIGDNPEGAKILLTRIAQGVGRLIGILGTIMIIIAGILYLTSAGSPERMTKAKTALTYAIIGIAIGISAEAITETILSILKD